MAKYSGELFPELDRGKRDKRRLPREFKLVHERYVKLTEDKIALIILFVLMVGVGCYLVGYKQGIARSGEKSSEQTALPSNQVQTKDNEVRVEISNQQLQPELESLSQDRYLIQLVTYKNKKYAQDEKIKLEKEGYNVIIKTSGKWSIVYTGYYPDRSQAEADLKKLRKNYRDAFIKKMKGGEDE